MESSAERNRMLSAVSAARSHLDRGFRSEQAGNLDRALEAYQRALSAQPSASESIEARLRIARVYRSMAVWDKSQEESRAAIQLANEIGADDLAAEAMNIQVGALQVQGFYDEADTLALEAIQRARSARVRGITLQNLGRSAAERRDFAASDRYFEQSIDAFRTAKYDIGLAVALANAAKAALDRGDANRALDIGHEAIALARKLNALDVLLTAVQNQAAAFAALGNLDSAELLLTEALGHFTSARNLVRQAECLELLGQVTESRAGAAETARRCYARARDLAVAAGDNPLVRRLSERLGNAGTSADTTPKQTR